MSEQMNITYRADKEKQDQAINALLFCLLTLFASLLSIGKVVASDTNRTSLEMPFLKGFTYYPEQAPDLWIYLLPLALYIPTFIFLFYRLSEKGKILPKRSISILFLGFIIFRIFSCFCFPYGEQDYLFTSPFDQSPIFVHYQGFTILERIITLSEEICFYGYYVFFFTYFKRLQASIALKTIYILFTLYFLFLLSLLFFSFMVESDKIANNISIYLSGHGSFCHITSYLNHRNTLGYFFFSGACMMLIAFLFKPNGLFVFFQIFYTLVCFVLFSKTPAILSLILLLALLFLYPIFYFHKHKTLSVVFIILASLFLIWVILTFTVLKTIYYDVYIKPILDVYTNSGTLVSRNHLTIACLSMETPYTWIFGFTKFPYTSIFKSYRAKLPIDKSVQNAHNAFVNILLEFGLPGLVLVLVVFGIIYFRMGRELFYKKNPRYLFWIAVLTANLIYSYIEPNMVFQRELTALFYVFIYLFPLELDLRFSKELAVVEKTLFSLKPKVA